MTVFCFDVFSCLHSLLAVLVRKHYCKTCDYGPILYTIRVAVRKSHVSRSELAGVVTEAIETIRYLNQLSSWLCDLSPSCQSHAESQKPLVRRYGQGGPVNLSSGFRNACLTSVRLTPCMLNIGIHVLKLLFEAVWRMAWVLNAVR